MNSYLLLQFVLAFVVMYAILAALQQMVVAVISKRLARLQEEQFLTGALVAPQIVAFVVIDIELALVLPKLFGVNYNYWLALICLFLVRVVFYSYDRLTVRSLLEFAESATGKSLIFGLVHAVTLVGAVGIPTVLDLGTRFP